MAALKAFGPDGVDARGSPGDCLSRIAGYLIEVEQACVWHGESLIQRAAGCRNAGQGRSVLRTPLRRCIQNSGSSRHHDPRRGTINAPHSTREFSRKAVTPDTARLLEDWLNGPGFRALSVGEALSQLRTIAPHYPHPAADQPIAICVNGLRWFSTEVEAVADAIFRSARRPHSLGSTLAGPDWRSEQNGDGLWAVPGRRPTRCPSALHLANVNPVDDLHVPPAAALRRNP